MGVDDTLENVLMFLSIVQFILKIGDILHHSNSHMRQLVGALTGRNI